MLNNIKHKFMILDFTDIINKTKHEKHIEFSIENVEDVVFDGDNIIFEGPVKVNGTASIVDDIISLNVNVKRDSQGNYLDWETGAITHDKYGTKIDMK